MNLKVHSAIKNYLIARRELLEAIKSSSELTGNDNIIGSRIGEYIAILYYRLVRKIETQKVHMATNPGYDLTYIEGGRVKKISVKLISSENKRGYTTRLQKNWDEFILIELGMDYKILKLGICTKMGFDKIQRKLNYSHIPTVKRTMLGMKGMIILSGGEIVSDKNIKKVNDYLFGK